MQADNVAVRFGAASEKTRDGCSPAAMSTPMACKVQSLRPMAITGDKCERRGLYLMSGACGHASERTAERDELLPRCHICGRPMTWTLLREFSAIAGSAFGNGEGDVWSFT
jgi:hypothetical protein